MQDWFEKVAPPMIMAIMGGVADFLTSEKHSGREFIVSVFLAGFIGYMTLLLCFDYDVSQARTGIIVGIAGYLSRPILKMIRKYGPARLARFLKVPNSENINLSDKKKDKDDD